MSIDITQLSTEEFKDLLTKVKLRIKSETKEIGSILPLLNAAHPEPSLTAKFYMGLDWTKSNGQLAKENNLTYTSVANWRRKLNKPFVKGSKWYPACLNWDWTKSNTAISRETGAFIRTVAMFRQKLGKPDVERDYQPECGPSIVDHVDFSNVDWATQTDSEIGKQVGCTREFSRQMRAKLGKPKMLAYQKKQKEFAEAFAGCHELNAKQVMEKFPNLGTITARKYCNAAGIKWGRSTVKCFYPWEQMNFQLPNIFLTEIWNLHANAAAIRRSNHSLERPLFYMMNGNVPDEFKDLVAQEQAKADAYFSQHINELEMNEK